MTNREKLFEILNKMDNRKLALIVNLPCNKCPCEKFCKNFTSISCNETIEEWLDNDNE